MAITVAMEAFIDSERKHAQETEVLLERMMEVSLEMMGK